tara:strand:- start:1619 stop:2209 length:591 start_codon:yes stop_codon:yes gene_type:complete
MSLVTRAADLFYTFRFLKLLVTPWDKMEAYNLGLVDENGKRIKSVKIDDPKKKAAYTPFHRLVFNVKRLINKAPGGKTKIASYLAGLYLIKEKYNLDEDSLLKIVEESGYEPLDFLSESVCEWFILEDKMISPGRYRVRESKIVLSTYEEIVNPKDSVIIEPHCYPVGEIFGIDVYKVVHERTNQDLYVILSDLYK